VAFAVGKNAAGNGFKIIGGHTDSPTLWKPRSKRASGTIQLGGECYGGCGTRFDRDLGILTSAGGSDGKIEQRLVKIDPGTAETDLELAIQFAGQGTRGLSVNKEDHLSPISAELQEGLVWKPPAHAKDAAGAKSDCDRRLDRIPGDAALLQLLATNWRWMLHPLA
jgi:aspartyl aminopeptidase